MMVDARDIAAVAAHELLRRDRAAGPQPAETITIVGPDAPFTGDTIAALWAEVLGRPVADGGDDRTRVEQKYATRMPSAMAYDDAAMFRRFQEDGMFVPAGTAERVTQLVGRPLTPYRQFAQETADGWRAAAAQGT